MKKTILLAALAVASLGFTSCESETDPVLQIPEAGSFVLNTPAMADQYLNLTKDGTFSVTCSQPDYGVAIQTIYELQVSSTADFKQFETVTPIEPSNPVITVNDNDVAIALCSLLGYKDRADFADKYTGEVTAYLRANCRVDGVENSAIVSNVVTLKHVGLYYAAAEPGWIYLVGNISGWKDPCADNEDYYNDWKLMETGIGTGIYTGSFAYTEAPMFRFYTALDADKGKCWDKNSLGYQVDDKSTEFEMTDNTFAGDMVNGKGNWSFPSLTSGTLRMEVDVNAMTVKFTNVAAGEEDWGAYKRIYMIGDAVSTGWNIDFDTETAACLYDRKGDGVYVSKEPVSLAAGEFRFYTAPGAWDSNTFGSQVDDAAIDITFPYSGVLVEGKGKWKMAEAVKVNMTVDMNKMTVDFQPAE